MRTGQWRQQRLQLQEWTGVSVVGRILCQHQSGMHLVPFCLNAIESSSEADRSVEEAWWAWRRCDPRHLQVSQFPVQGLHLSSRRSGPLLHADSGTHFLPSCDWRLYFQKVDESRLFKAARAFHTCTLWPWGWHSFLRKDRDPVFSEAGRTSLGWTMTSIAACFSVPASTVNSQGFQQVSKCCPCELAWMM